MRKMKKDNFLTVTDIQRFCMHDGPGVRTTVFLKGCPLRCAWCHNPETQKGEREMLFYSAKCIGCGACAKVCPAAAHEISEAGHVFWRERCTLCGRCALVCPTEAMKICGTRYTVEEVLAEVEKDRAFYGDKGGITVSGGEPFLQGEDTLALLRAAKERGLSTVVETCGQFDTGLIRDAISCTDLFLWDVKDTDSKRHQRYTGVGNEKILSNLALVDSLGGVTRLRCILVNGVNTDEAHYQALAELAKGLKHCQGVEFIPYHAYGGSKSTFLGLDDTGRVDWIPSRETVDAAKETLRRQNVNVIG